jgi:hypothetical protein
MGIDCRSWVKLVHHCHMLVLDRENGPERMEVGHRSILAHGIDSMTWSWKHCGKELKVWHHNWQGYRARWTSSGDGLGHRDGYSL